MKKTFFLLCVLALISMFVFSCAQNEQLTDPSEELGSEENLSLEKEFGGYDSNDEAVAFGDTELLLEAPAEQDAADSYATDIEVVQALSYDGSGVTDLKAYFLRVTFGLLEGDSTATEVIDWSGSAEVNKGTLVVLRKIRFEDDDSIIHPRDSRKKVEFISKTKQHFDGLVFAIVDNDSTDMEGTFTFTAGSYSTTLSFSELDSTEILDAVGSAGHEVSIVSRSKEYTPFAGGFVTGRWIKKNDRGGKFKGRWINSLGSDAGHLHGIWGTTLDGQQVFKGKYVNHTGEFRGLISGRWRYDHGANGGSFGGHWVNRAHDKVGEIKGKFKTGRPGDERGFFHARYRETNRNNSEGN